MKSESLALVVDCIRKVLFFFFSPTEFILLQITSRNASRAYLNMVDNSYLGSSNEVTKLMEKVEAAFVKHFANGNHRKGMDILRPKVRRERHRITFFYGNRDTCSYLLVISLK